MLKMFNIQILNTCNVCISIIGQASGNKTSRLTYLAFISSSLSTIYSGLSIASSIVPHPHVDDKAKKLDSRSILLKADNGCVFLEVYILVGTEVFCERYAGEVPAPGAVIDGGEVEDEGEHQKDEEGDAEAEDH